MERDTRLALKITETLKEKLDDDYEDMERPDYDAMLYALRDIKELLNSAIDREVNNKNQPQEPYFLMKGDLFYRHSYRGYSDFSAWAGVYDKDEAIAYAEKSGGSVIAKPARNFYHEPEEIDRMIERLQLIRQALRDSPNGY